MTYLKKYWNFFDGLAIRTLSFYAGGTGLISDQGTKIPHGPRCSQKVKRKTQKTPQNTNISRPGHINTVSITETNFSPVPILIKSPLTGSYMTHTIGQSFSCNVFHSSWRILIFFSLILLKSFGIKVRSPNAISIPQKPSTSEDTKPNQGDDLVRKGAWDLSGGPVTKTLHSQCRGPGFDPWSGN